MTSVSRAFTTLTAVALLVVSGRHSSDAARHGKCRTLAVESGWYGDICDRINAMIKQLGSCGGSPDRAPLALFDWDNTMIRNDIGHAKFYWVVRNSKVRQPARIARPGRPPR